SQSGDSGGSMGGDDLTAQQQEKPFPFLAVWPNQIHFGKVKRYETAHRLVSVMNTGGAALRVKRVANLDPDAPFRVTGNSCNGKTLNPGASCSFRVRFNPLGIKGEYISGFDIETDDSDNNSYYNGLVEVRGGSAYNYWAYLLRYYKLSGTLGKAEFGRISAGSSLTQNIHVINTTGETWRDIKLDKKELPAAYTIASETCSGKTFGAWGYCRITVQFAPTDGNVRRLDRNYGKYNFMNINTQARGVSANPRYPEVIESLNFSKPRGVIKLTAKGGVLSHQRRVKTSVQVTGEACAKFPVKGALRSGRFWYFR
ncbi:MAG: choice-of-anchor D domain-containing protein, partial [Elusimicrobiales bacterium]|nr:choice-of-anchor D domain-containing protein [Elusimicrobiales bacterium]